MEPQTFTRRQLYELVWKEPIQALAARFGLSDVGLAKLCDRHGIPTPPRGYWAKKQASHRVLRAPLLEFADSRVSSELIVARLVLPSAPITDEGPDPLVSFWRGQRDEIGAVKVARALNNPHPVVAAWISPTITANARCGRAWAVSAQRPSRPPRWSAGACGCSAPCTRRSRPWASPSPASVMLVSSSFGTGVTAPASTSKEYVAQKRRPLTDAERAEYWGDQKYRVEQIQTGLLRGKVDACLPKGVPTLWTESEQTPFEDVLCEVAATILTALAKAKVQREQYEAAERKRWEEREAERKAQEAAKAECKRKRALRQRVKHWRRAQDLRSYVTAVQAAVAEGQLSVDA